MKEEDLGPFPPHCTSVCVISKEVVTQENLGEILGVTPFELHPLINPANVVSVYYFHNGSLRNSGTLTIWHDRNRAAIKTYMASISGEWLQGMKLVVSDEEEVGWTENGQLLTGRLAMDVNGTQGVYSCGEFFPTSIPCAVGF